MGFGRELEDWVFNYSHGAGTPFASHEKQVKE